MEGEGETERLEAAETREWPPLPAQEKVGGREGSLEEDLRICLQKRSIRRKKEEGGDKT